MRARRKVASPLPAGADAAAGIGGADAADAGIDGIDGADAAGATAGGGFTCPRSCLCAMDIQLNVSLLIYRIMIGYHVEKNGDLARLSLSDRIITAYDQLVGMGLNPCIQVFIAGPRGTNIIATPADIARLASWPHRGRVVIHGTYIDSPWKLAPVSIANIRAELEISDRMGATGVIVHLPSLTGGLDNITSALSRIAQGAPRSSIMWLEIKAAKSRDGTFETPAKLGNLFRTVLAQPQRPKVGLCIDTQHLFACGVSFRDYDTTMDWLTDTRKALDAAAADADPIPIMIHLNDSQSALGSGIDKHAGLGQGQIWQGYGLAAGQQDPSFSGIMAVLVWAELNDVQVILETPNPMADIGLIRGLGVMRA